MKGSVKELIAANYYQVSLVFFAFLTMVLLCYFYVGGIVREQMNAIIQETMNTTQASVTSTLEEAELAFANTVYTTEAMLHTGKSQQEIEDFFAEMTAYFQSEATLLPDFVKLYAFVRGEYLDGTGWVPPDGFDPTQTSWYIGATEYQGQIYYSNPYVDEKTGGAIISFSREVFSEEGQALGVVSVDLNLSRITDYISSQKSAGNGYGLLLSETMMVTAHRDHALIGRDMSEISDEYARLVRMIEENDNVFAQRFVDADGVDSVAFFRTILNGWYIGTITPRSCYDGQLRGLAVTLGVVGFVLMAALSALLIHINAEKLRSDEGSRSKSSFLARMSHEMRTPMNAIIGMTSIARGTKDPERMQYCLGKIEDAAGHLLGIINDVLDISKIEAGKLELSETDFVVERMVAQVTGMATFKMEEKKQKLSVSVAPNVPFAIVADRQRLTQVMANLMSNATKFTPEGGTIDLTVRCLSKENNWCTLEIAVRDSGIGIPEEQQGKLFHSFEQADGSVSRRFGGTGLGLAISKNIVEMMGGGIYVESKPNEGARFAFTVRVRVGATQSEDEPNLHELDAADAASPRFHGKRILLVEDVEINREILLSLLEDTGVEIDCAENGKEACDRFAAANGTYDLIFMDIHMPVMDGYEATATIRAMEFPGADSIPIVAMTANVFREDVEKCLTAGMNAHIGKPLEMADVIGKMKQFL